MTVGELVSKLMHLDQNLPVLVPGYETGAELATTARLVTVEDRDRPGRPSYFGRYELVREWVLGQTALYIAGNHDPL